MTFLLIILLIVFLAAALIYRFVIRPWHLRWGATDDEIRKALPGDELAPPHPQLDATHAITINASADNVWPWLAQMGQHRGGFYSYTGLENMVGCRMRNANRIVPEWQSVKLADEIWLHPKAPPLPVEAIEPGRMITLKGWGPFYIEPIDERTSRLIIRSRGNFDPDLRNRFLNFLLWRILFEPIHFIMERKMMLVIKQRSERERTRAASRTSLTIQLRNGKPIVKRA